MNLFLFCPHSCLNKKLYRSRSFSLQIFAGWILKHMKQFRLVLYVLHLHAINNKKPPYFNFTNCEIKVGNSANIIKNCIVTSGNRENCLKIVYSTNKFKWWTIFVDVFFFACKSFFSKWLKNNVSSCCSALSLFTGLFLCDSYSSHWSFFGVKKEILNCVLKICLYMDSLSKDLLITSHNALYIRYNWANALPPSINSLDDFPESNDFQFMEWS